MESVYSQAVTAGLVTYPSVTLLSHLYNGNNLSLLSTGSA